MVMQARKLPRLSDGYFDRNQSHSFENSGKYSKSSDRDKIKNSPISSNSDTSSRNDYSENKNSPRYHRPCSQRQKDKDYHEDSNKSPIVRGDSKNSSSKDFKSQSSSDRDGPTDRYRSNHDRNTTEENEKRIPVVDWSEHISSSGKKYYYNCRTEISQWEKPKELIEWERQQSLNRLANDQRNKERTLERLNQASGSKNSHDNSSSGGGDHHAENHHHHPSNSEEVAEAKPGLLSPSQVTASNLPKLISQLTGTKGFTNLSELSPQEALRTIQQALVLTKQVKNLSQNADSLLQANKSQASPSAQPQTNQTNHHPVSSALPTSIATLPTNHHHHSTNHSTTSTSSVPPPTLYPPSKAATDQMDQDRTTPESDSSTHSLRHGDSPTSSVSSFHSLGTPSLSQASSLKPSIPSLTPSLANYYREDLITHVTGWQADHAERQANRYSEESHSIGSLNCAQVSAELKVARALVRLAEIQATLQEQRILFLRQQTKELEDWRSLNSFMGDS